jgi:hypothetical protein
MDLTVVEAGESVGPDLLCIISRFPALQSLLVLQGSISGAVLHELARYCPQLHTLTADYLCWGISAKALQFFIQRCPRLVKLSINVTTALTDKVLLVLAQRSWYLQELYINKDARVTEHGLVQLVVSCKHLCVLHYRKIKAGVRRRLIALVQARGAEANGSWTLANSRRTVLSKQLRELARDAQTGVCCQRMCGGREGSKRLSCRTVHCSDVAQP